MMNALSDHTVWKEYIEHKTSNIYLTEKEKERLNNFFEQRAYLNTAQKLQAGGTFNPPTKKEISKISTNKKELYILMQKTKT